MNQHKWQSNGKQQETAPSLRLTIIAPSIVSDIGNPLATTLRAVTRALIRQGHAVTVWEERRNAPVRLAMALHGATPLRAFYERYPDIPYRTYELPSPRELALWLGFQVAISDAVLAFRGIPENLWQVLCDFDATPAVKLLESGQLPGAGSIDLVADIATPGAERVSFGPAVLSEPLSDASRTGSLVVIYDNNDLVADEQAELLAQGCRFVRSGTWLSPGLEYVPEVDLEQCYRTASAVHVVGAGDVAAAISRRLLPVATGCVSLPWTVGADASPKPLPVANDASLIAGNLVAFVKSWGRSLR